jgi:DNA-binding CsgD family transcriptional regulator
MDTDASISKLLVTLYSAPMQPEKWDAVLAQLADLNGVSKIALIGHDFNDKDHRISACFGDTVRDSAPEYESHYCQFDVWTLRFPKTRVPGKVVRGEEIWPEYLMRQSVFYNEFLKKYDVCQMAVLVSSGTPGLFEALSIYRGPQENPFENEQLAILQELSPHLQTALSLRRRLLALERRATDLENGLNKLATAVVLVDAAGKPIFVNRAATQICSQRDGLCLSTSCVSVEDVKENGRLREIISKATSALGTTNPGSGSAMLISRDGRRPLQLFAAPFLSEHSRPRGAAVILFISDPELKPAVRSDVLRELYGLTQAETRVALSLLADQSLVETADQMGVAHETVRSQLKSVLHKTGTRRQGELIRLLSNLPGI